VVEIEDERRTCFLPFTNGIWQGVSLFFFYGLLRFRFRFSNEGSKFAFSSSK